MKRILSILILAAILVLPIVTSADVGDVGPIIAIVTDVIRTFQLLAGIMVALMILVAGFMFLTASGDASRVSTAKSTALWAVIGAVVIILAEVAQAIVSDWAA